jgi:hypothetical protein
MKGYVFKNFWNVFQLFHHILFLLKFINSKSMGMVMLVMSLQMWIKLNQYYHVYHMMVQ